MTQTHRPKPLWESPLSAFFEIAQEWELTEWEQADLLGITLEHLKTWRSQPWIDLPWEIMMRIGNIFAIHRALNLRFDSSDARNVWLRRPGTLLGMPGKTPLAVMSSTDGLHEVRDFLEARLQGW